MGQTIMQNKKNIVLLVKLDWSQVSLQSISRDFEMDLQGVWLPRSLHVEVSGFNEQPRKS